LIVVLILLKIVIVLQVYILGERID